MSRLQDALDIFKGAVQEVATPGNTALHKTCVNKEHSVVTGALNSRSTAHRGRIDTEQLALALAAKRLPTIHGQLRNEHRESKTWRWFSDVISSNCHFMAQPYKILQAWNPLDPYRPSVYLSTPRSLGGWALPHIATARLQGRKGDNVALVASREAPSKARANRDNLGSCRSLWRAAPKVGIYENII